MLELLCAASITVLLAGILIALSSGTLSVWKRTQDDFVQTTQARLALDLIERDLQGAAMRVERGGAWLAADYQTSASALPAHGWTMTGPRMKPSGASSLKQPVMAGDAMSISEARFGLGGTWLRMVTGRDATNTEVAAPTVVAYQILRRPVSGSTSAIAREDLRYALYRSVVRVTTSGVRPGAFESGYDVLSAPYLTPSGQQGDPGTIVSPNLLDALAANVIDFGVWVYVQDDSAVNLLRRAYPLSGVISHAVTTAPVPIVADVMIRVLSDEGATAIQAIEQGKVTRPDRFSSDEAWWWGIAEMHSHVVTRRIKIEARAGL